MQTSQPHLSERSNLLFVDDEKDILSSIRRLMRKVDANIYFANSGKEALEIFEKTAIDIIISDMRMPEMNGAELLAKISDLYPETIRIVLSGYSDADMIMSSINKGKIWSYINKPWDNNQLILSIEHAIFTQQIIAERALLKRTLVQYQTDKKDQFQGFIGQSLPMQNVYNSIEKAAPSSAAVFITGASGTGKEVTAKAIHDLSPRKDKPFIVLNCAAIPAELMESEIFGHIKGAFSGAINHRDGAASIANGGTLFLDEISEMDISLQAKLLRFIQSQTFQKVGSSKVEEVDIRFISATNKSPSQSIEQKELREDLYYRLSVINIDLPLLSERKDDILLIAKYFLKNFAIQENKSIVGFTKDSEKILSQYEWPGNVRQLKNCIHNAVIMSVTPLIEHSTLSQSLLLKNEDIEKLILDKKNQNTVLDTPKNNIENKIIPLATVEKMAIENAIALCEDNVVKAANLLEVSPSTLYRKVQSWSQ